MSMAGICNRRVVMIGAEESVLEAATLMREQHVGDVVVTRSNGRRIPIGIITDRDIVVAVVAPGLDPKLITVGDVMQRQLVTAPMAQGVQETLQQMRAKGVRRMPLVDDGGALVGIVTLDDLLQLLADEFQDLARLIDQEKSVEEHRRP